MGGVILSLITYKDYEKFLEIYLFQDLDQYGRVLRGELRRRVIEWRGSHPKTYKNHEKNLVEFGYLSDWGGYYQVNEPYFTGLKKRVQANKEERDKLALVQRHLITGETLSQEYGSEHKKVSDISEIVERIKREDQVKRIDKALGFIGDRGKQETSSLESYSATPPSTGIVSPPQQNPGQAEQVSSIVHFPEPNSSTPVLAAHKEEKVTK